MNIRSISIGLIAASSLTLAPLSISQAAPVGDQPGGPTGQPIYIEALKAELAQRGSPGDGSRSAEKVEKNASALTDALVRELNARGVAASRLSEQDPAPHTGWVVSGVFTENVPKGLFSGLRSIGSSTPNTEVRVSISDLGAASGEPAQQISTAAQLGGQGSSLSFNPYEMAAKVVVHRVAGNRSIDDLAKRIAEQILAQRASSAPSKV